MAVRPDPASVLAGGLGGQSRGLRAIAPGARGSRGRRRSRSRGHASVAGVGRCGTPEPDPARRALDLPDLGHVAILATRPFRRRSVRTTRNATTIASTMGTRPSTTACAPDGPGVTPKSGAKRREMSIAMSLPPEPPRSHSINATSAVTDQRRRQRQDHRRSARGPRRADRARRERRRRPAPRSRRARGNATTSNPAIDGNQQADPGVAPAPAPCRHLAGRRDGRGPCSAGPR